MAERVASLYAELGVETSKLKRGLTEAKSDLEQTSAQLKKFDTAFNQSFVTGLDKGSASLKDFGGIMLDAADKTGLGASQMAKMAETSGLFTSKQIEAGQATAAVAAKAEELSQAVAKGTMTADEAGRAFRKFANENRVLATDMNAVANASLAVGAGFAAIAGAGGVAIKSTTQLAARVETLGVVTAVMGKNVGMTESQVRALEKAIKEKGITTQASRQAIAQMIQAEIRLANATDLARLAQDAAVISGENSSMAFERLVTVIATGNILMARRMGLLVDFQGAYEREAKTLGKSTDALSEQERVQIRVNEVLRKGENIAGAYTAAMDTAGKKAASLARLQEEAALAIGTTFLPVYGEMIDAVTDGLTAFNKMEDGQKSAIGETLGYTTAIAGANAATFLAVGTFLKAKTALDAMAASLGYASKAALLLKVALPVAAITLVTIAAIKLIAINKQVAESTEDVHDAWTKLLDAQVTSGASASQISDTFLKRQEDVKRILEETNPIVRAFIGSQNKLTGNYAQLEGAVRKTAGNYEEYRASLEKVAKANGMLIDKNGNLIKSMAAQGKAGYQLVETNYAITESAYQSMEAARKLGEAFDNTGLKIGRDTLRGGYWDDLKAGMESLADIDLADTLKQSMTDLETIISGTLGQSIEDFRTKQRELGEEATYLQSQINALAGTQPTSTEQLAALDDMRASLGDVNQAIIDNATVHEEATKRILFNLLLQRAELMLTTDEQKIAFYGLATEIAHAWGLVDTATFEMVKRMDSALIDFAAGGGVESARAAIYSIGNAATAVSGDYYIDFIVRVHQLAGDDMLGEQMARKRYIENRVPPPVIDPSEVLDRFKGGGGRAGAAYTPPERPQKTELEKLLEGAGAAESLGSFAATSITKNVIDPLKQELEGLDKLMGPGFIDLYAMENMVALERRRAEAAEKLAEAEKKVLEFRKQQERLGFLEQQIRLLDMIRENSLNANDVLGGLKLGLDADMGEVLKAMTRAMGQLVTRAEAELGIASKSKKFRHMGLMIDAGLIEGLWSARAEVEKAMTGILAVPDLQLPRIDAGAFTVPNLSAASMSQPGASPIMQNIDVSMDIANINNMIDWEDAAYRMVDIIKRRTG